MLTHWMDSSYLTWGQFSKIKIGIRERSVEDLARELFPSTKGREHYTHKHLICQVIHGCVGGQTDTEVGEMILKAFS